MNYQELVNFSVTLHKLADSQNSLTQDIARFRRENGIDDPHQLAQACQSLQDENRLMNIGIVGRVKAGKSSLLNALVFDGEPILPKAATPMTAALTTITWGEVFQAKVEFYSDHDINAIRHKASQFSARLAARQSECLEELLKRHRSRDNDAPVDMQKLTSMADKRALSELQREEGLFAAHDQFQRMERSGLDASALKAHSEIQASTPQELAERLHDYVGVNGRFMPFTKAVNIAMPLEALRDICIIDTPGMNDPVQSREERTVELLKTCDVVFIVSPAGQFLTEQDLEVMGRITQKEGVQELVLVASQIDTQLYGSEKRARLSDAVDAIRQQLSVRAKNTLTSLKQGSPEVGAVFDNLLASVHTKLLHSSGLCHSLNRRFETPECWDSNEKVTWENLNANYPDYFSLDNPELSLGSLDRLANTKELKVVLAQVREKKAEITHNKLTTMLGLKQRNLEAFQNFISKLARDQILQIRNANAQHLDEQMAFLESKRLELSQELDVVFKYSMADYRQRLRDDMRSKATELLRETEANVERAQGSYSETITAEKKGLGSWFARKIWGGGYTEKTEVRAKIVSSQVVNNIKTFMTEIQDELDIKVEHSHRWLDQELGKTLTPTIREVLQESTNVQMVRQAITSAIYSIPEPNFALNIPLPDNLKSRGTLKGYEAEQFKDASDDFIGSLSSKVKIKISEFIKEVEANMPLTISDAFIDEIQGRINLLKDQVNNAAQATEGLERLARKVEGVKL